MSRTTIDYLLAAAFLTAACTTAVLAQSESIRRTASGRPNLTGSYDAATLTPLGPAAARKPPSWYSPGSSTRSSMPCATAQAWKSWIPSVSTRVHPERVVILARVEVRRKVVGRRGAPRGVVDDVAMGGLAQDPVLGRRLRIEEARRLGRRRPDPSSRNAPARAPPPCREPDRSWRLDRAARPTCACQLGHVHGANRRPQEHRSDQGRQGRAGPRRCCAARAMRPTMESPSANPTEADGAKSIAEAQLEHREGPQHEEPTRHEERGRAGSAASRARHSTATMVRGIA